MLTLKANGVRIEEWAFKKGWTRRVWHEGEKVRDMVYEADAVVAFVGGKPAPEPDAAEALRWAKKRGIKVKELEF